MTMVMGSALPDWVTPVAWIYIAVALVSAALIAVDIYMRGRRHDTVASELVWVSSALYLGPFAIPAYARWGRAAADGASSVVGSSTSAVAATLPGGGASAVAHLIGVPLVVAVGWSIAGLAMWPMIIVIFILATLMLAAYELASDAGRAGRGRRMTWATALFAGAVTVAAFDVGMVGWMLVLHFNDLMPAVSEGSFWFLMQIGVIVGLATGYPVVKWLLSRGGTAVPV